MAASIDTLQQILFELAGVLPSDTGPLFNLTSKVSLEPGEAYIGQGDTSPACIH